MWKSFALSELVIDKHTRNYATSQHFLYLPVPRAIRSSKMSPRKDVYITPAAPSRKWS